MLKFKDMYNGMVVFNKDWTCGLEEQDNVELALHCEITDMDEATGDPQFKEYPFVFSVQIVVANPHESFRESRMHNKKNKMTLIKDTVSYMGGVPIGHKLIETDKLNKNITGDLKASEAMMVTVTHDYGTVAAQRGPGTVTAYPQFRTEEGVKGYAKELIELYGDPIMRMVGFILDQPINMIGDTGWSVIENQVKGKKA